MHLTNALALSETMLRSLWLANNLREETVIIEKKHSTRKSFKKHLTRYSHEQIKRE